ESRGRDGGQRFSDDPAGSPSQPRPPDDGETPEFGSLRRWPLRTRTPQAVHIHTAALRFEILDTMASDEPELRKETEVPPFDFKGATFDLDSARDREILRFILSQALYGEATGVY